MINFAVKEYIKNKARQILSKMAHFSFAIVVGRKFFVKEEKILSAH
jgi:hypothetical protein